MINAISNILTNPTLVNVAQNTTSSITYETTLKAIGRPGFILIDKDIDQNTKRYAAAKEFLYQATCLGIYLMFLAPFVKKGAFHIAKKYIYKGEQGFNKFKSADEYLFYRKVADKTQQNRSSSLSKDHSIYKLNHDGLREELINKETPELFPHIKGAIEIGNTIGSVIGLAIVAPQVSHTFIHPTLKLLGLDKKTSNTQKLDKKA